MKDEGSSARDTMNVHIVVDASVAVKWFLNEDNSMEASRLLDTRFRLHAPDLLYAEFGQTIWKRVRLRHEISASEGEEVLQAFAAIPMVVHSITPLIESAFRIAVATGGTVYDSLYTALAVSIDRRLVTADRKFYQVLVDSGFEDDLVWVGDIDQAK